LRALPHLLVRLAVGLCLPPPLDVLSSSAFFSFLTLRPPAGTSFHSPLFLPVPFSPHFLFSLRTVGCDPPFPLGTVAGDFPPLTFSLVQTPVPQAWTGRNICLFDLLSSLIEIPPPSHSCSSFVLRVFVFLAPPQKRLVCLSSVFPKSSPPLISGFTPCLYELEYYTPHYLITIHRCFVPLHITCEQPVPLIFFSLQCSF